MPKVSNKQLLEAFGSLPNAQSTPTVGNVLQRLRSNVNNRVLITEWLTLQGIPREKARSALDESCAKAYVFANYLRGWRNKVNPHFAVLDDGPTMDDGDFGSASNAHSANSESNADANAQYSDDNAWATIERNRPPVENERLPPGYGTELWLKQLFLQIDITFAKLFDQKLEQHFADDWEAAKSVVRTELENYLKAEVETEIESQLDTRMTKWMKDRETPRRLEIHIAGTAAVDVGLQHKNFDKLLRACAARDSKGNRLNVWFTGPTGSGKTTAAENVAKSLGLSFHSDGSLDADYKVLGFRDANGNVISTQFLDAYRNGGVYVADEIDNWLPSALLSLNAALANGFVSAPEGIIRRHRDFVCIACANTWGLGATNDYVGRNKLDAASLDRFHPKLDWPVDENLERAIADGMAPYIGHLWCDVIHYARNAAKRSGLKIIVSPRSTFNGIALLLAGFPALEVITMTFGAGIDENQLRAITTPDTNLLDNIDRFVKEEIARATAGATSEPEPEAEPETAAEHEVADVNAMNEMLGQYNLEDFNPFYRVSGD